MLPSSDPLAASPGRLLQLYPMTVSDVLDGAFRGWRAVAGWSTAAVLFVLGPLEVVRHLVTSRVAPAMLTGPVFLDDPAFMDAGALAIVFVLGLLANVAAVYASATVLIVVADADRGLHTRLGSAFAAALRPAAMALVALLLVFLAGLAVFAVSLLMIFVTVGLAAIVLVPVGFVGLPAFAAVAALVVPVAAIERRGPIATLGRAIWVLRVRFWRTIGISWLVLFVMMGISAGVTFLLQMLAVAVGPAAWIVLALSQLVVHMVQLPVVSVAALLVFLDARMLREGYDLEVRASRLAVA